jgi:hypothetical protein
MLSVMMAFSAMALSNAQMGFVLREVPPVKQGKRAKKRRNDA